MIFSLFLKREFYQANVLKSTFDALSPEDQELLARELSLSETYGIDSFATAPNYEATGFHNMSRKAREVTRDAKEECRLALNYGVCFARVIEAMQRSHPDVVQAMRPVSFGKLAFLANLYPYLFDPATFRASEKIDRVILKEEHRDEFAGLIRPFDTPVAMFALKKHVFRSQELVSEDLSRAYELTYVYVDRAFRHAGFPRQIVETAQSIAKTNQASIVVLDTLRPNLTAMYEKMGAKVVCEG